MNVEKGRGEKKEKQKRKIKENKEGALFELFRKVIVCFPIPNEVPSPHANDSLHPSTSHTFPIPLSWGHYQLGQSPVLMEVIFFP